MIHCLVLLFRYDLWFQCFSTAPFNSRFKSSSIIGAASLVKKIIFAHGRIPQNQKDSGVPGGGSTPTYLASLISVHPLTTSTH